MKLGVLVYLEHENKVLMIHRQKEDEHKGYWLREYQEETGLTPEGLQIKAVLSFPDLGDSPFGDEWQVFLFHADRFKGELTDHCPEGQLQWVARDKLQELPMWEGDLLFTPRVFRPGFFSGKMLYRGNRLEQSIFWE